jgi:hypothetical protein
MLSSSASRHSFCLGVVSSLREAPGVRVADGGHPAHEVWPDLWRLLILLVAHLSSHLALAFCISVRVDRETSINLRLPLA